MTINRTYARRFSQAMMAAAGLLLALNAAHAAETVTYYHTDALGTPVMESNAAGTVTYAREHKPYGEQALGAVKNGPGFTGHVGDVDTGLTYMQARYFDPVASRFLSNDPIASDLSSGANYNRYWYANNNPYKFTDPDGRKPDDNNDPAPRDCGGQPCSERRKEKEQRDRERNSDMIIARAASYSGPGAVFTSQGDARDAAKSYITESNGGPILGTLFGQSYLTNVTQIDSSPDLFTYSLTPIITGMAPSAMIRGASAGLITGYTRHGINSAISHAGGGVAPRAILGAVKNPIQVMHQSGGRVMYVGTDATVVLNAQGRVITTYPTSVLGRRLP